MNKIMYILLIIFSSFSIVRSEEITVNLKLLRPTPPTTIVRISGPTHGTYTGCNCLMCIGNDLTSQHGISRDYLNTIGYEQWQNLHDNLHNSSTFIKHINSGKEMESLFAPTPLDVVIPLLELAQITPNDIVYDLGCGDGRVLILSSLIYKCRSVGIDIDDVCVQRTKDNIKLNKLNDLIRVYKDDITTTKFEDYSTVVFIYLMPDLGVKLIPKLNKLKSGSRIIVHDKAIPGIKFDSKHIIKSKIDGRAHEIYIKKLGYL